MNKIDEKVKKLLEYDLKPTLRGGWKITEEMRMLIHEIAEEMYLNSGFYDGDMDDSVENHKEKIVKCRKDHKCSACQNTIKKGDQALYESGFMDGAPVSCYTCLKCIEDWLEESGQIESED